MPRRELTPIELEQRKKLDERLKGRKLKPVGDDFWDDCGIPVCTCEDCCKPVKDHSHGYNLESCRTCVKGPLIIPVIVVLFDEDND